MIVCAESVPMPDLSNVDLSVIIPCHNLENYIVPLLVSLQLQFYKDKNIELIFVCDSCTDNTRQKIEFYPWETTSYSVRIIETDAHNCGLARNIGFEAANGKYIWFLDGDDWLINCSAFELVCNVLTAFPDEPLVKIPFLAPNTLAKEIKTYFSMVWQYIFRKEFIDDIRFENVEPSEDVIFMETVINKRKDDTFLKINTPLYYYNFGRPNSNMMRAIDRLKEEYEKNNGNRSEQ